MRRSRSVLGACGSAFLAVASLVSCSLTTSLDGLTGGAAGDGAPGSSDAAGAASDAGDAAQSRDAVSDAVNDAPMADPLAEGLVGYWRFDESSGLVAADSSGHGNDGMLENGATHVAGRVGGALMLDGTSSYVLVPASASLDVTTTMSVALWLKPRTLGSGPRLLSRVNSWDVKLNSGSPQLSDEMSYAISSGTIGLNVWHHIAAVFQGGLTTIYIDGQATTLSSNTFPVGRSLRSTTDDLLIGAYAPTSDFTDGILDEVRLYGRALTADEVALLAR